MSAAIVRVSYVTKTIRPLRNLLIEIETTHVFFLSFYEVVINIYIKILLQIMRAYNETDVSKANFVNRRWGVLKKPIVVAGWRTETAQVIATDFFFFKFFTYFNAQAFQENDGKQTVCR